MSEFWSMSGYGIYVWPSYALFIGVLVWDALAPVMRQRRVRRTLALRARREAARRTS